MFPAENTGLTSNYDCGKGLALVSQAPIYDTIFPETGTPCFLNLSGAIIILHTQFSAYVEGGAQMRPGITFRCSVFASLLFNERKIALVHDIANYDPLNNKKPRAVIQSRRDRYALPGRCFMSLPSNWSRRFSVLSIVSLNAENRSLMDYFRRFLLMNFLKDL